MKPILQTATGQTWREVLSVEDAMRVGEITKTAFGYDLKDERKRGGDGRYFVLGDECVVVGRIPGSGPLTTAPFGGMVYGPEAGQVRALWAAPVFVAHRNGDPFPRFALEIAELGRKIGVDLNESAYPNRKVPDEEFGPGSP